MAPYLLSAAEAAARIRDGLLTSEELVRSCLERIEARDPTVKAWLHLDAAGAIKAAREIDKRRPLSRVHGLPFGVKDMIETGEMPTTYNSVNWQGHQPARDAACVAAMRASGAILIGKTDTVEFAAVGRNAATRNPINSAHTPGGSSSGSGAAVGDFQVPLALGTQTGGSLIRPASFNGVYGFKPTWGTVSTEGARTFSKSLDTIGWYGRSIDDLEILAEVFRLKGVGSETVMKKGAVRVALCRTPFWSSIEPPGEVAFAEAAERLARHGFRTVDLSLPKIFGQLIEAQDFIMRGEACVSFLDEQLTQGARLGPEFNGFLDRSKAVSAADLLSAHNLAAACRVEFEAMFERFDVVLAPAAPGEAPKGLHGTGSHIFNAIWSILHVPCLSIPCTFGPTGLPLGVQVVGPRFTDRRLIAVARLMASAIDVERTTISQGPE